MSIQTIESMATWVENNITEDIDLKKMASHVGYSSFYCSSKFREHMGITFKQYVARCKLHAATIDLCNTDDKIIEIAFRYGYSSSESFTRAFSEAFHCPPSHYRKYAKGYC